MQNKIAALVILAFTVLAAPVVHGQDPEAQTSVTIHEKGALEGYTLLAPLRSRTTYLIDMQGQVVHTWESDLPPGQSAYLTDEGHLFRAGRIAHPLFHGGGQGGRIQEFSWDGELLWDATLSNESNHAHHDFTLLPNGNLLVLAWDKMTASEALEAGRNPEAISGREGFWPDAIFELVPERPTGFRVAWEWHARDHMVQDLYPERANFGDVIDHPERIDVNFDVRDEAPMTADERREARELEDQMRDLGYTGEDPHDGHRGGPDDRKRADWMHCNSIDYQPDTDLILVSSRSMSEVFVIDHSTTTEAAASNVGGRFGRGGDLLYRWGNPANYGLGSDEQRTLFVQHDAKWLIGEGDSLSFTVFNNGAERRGEEYSEVSEVLTPFRPSSGFRRDPGQSFEPDQPTWSYGEAEHQRFFSPFISGAQRLSNGNTLIASGVEGRAFEVTAQGQVVWEFVNPFFGDVPLMEPHPGPEGGPGPPAPDDLAKNGIFRATRYALDDPAVAGRF